MMPHEGQQCTYQGIDTHARGHKAQKIVNGVPRLLLARGSLVDRTPA